MQVVDALRRVPIFSKLPEDKLAWIAEQGEEIVYSRSFEDTDELTPYLKDINIHGLFIQSP